MNPILLAVHLVEIGSESIMRNVSTPSVTVYVFLIDYWVPPIKTEKVFIFLYANGL